MDILNRLLSVALSLGILAIAIEVRRTTRNWASPACLFCGFWFIFSFVPLIALPAVPVNPLAIGYIFLCCGAFSLPVLSTNWDSILRQNSMHALSRGEYLASPFVRGVFLTSFFTSILFLLLDLVVQGITLEQMIFNFFESSNAYLEMRYEGEIKSNPFGQWGLIAAYMCVTFGGFIHARTSTRGRTWLTLGMAMTPPILVMMVQSAKGLFFLAIAIILGANLINRILSDERPYLDLKALVLQLRYLIIVAPFVIISFLTRGLHAIDDNDEVVQRIGGYLASYAFLHIYAFSDWFTYSIGQHSFQSYTSEPLAFGYYSFISMFKLLGSSKVVPSGVYDEYFAFGNLSPGNIYTIYRGLITDFGYLGALVALFLIGWIFNFAYKRMLDSKYPAVSIAVVILFFQVLYTSYIVSAMMWNTTYLVTVLIALLLVINRAVHITSHRPSSVATPSPPDSVC